MTNRAERRAAARTPPPRYGDPRGGRIAFLPSVLAAAAVLAGLGIPPSGGYLVVRFVVTVLAAIVGVFALQGRGRWWLMPIAAIVVIWNPVVPIVLTGAVWTVAQIVAVGALVAAGLTIRRPD